ncbi:MAG TPA: CBS domain-containing protein [Polyangiaceae bacterium]|nr:CBS domain-containing protein [Polyangiaceae bacterium]
MTHAHRVPVQKYMTSSLLTADRCESLVSAYHRLSKSGVGQLPVLDTGKLVGIVSLNDLALAEHLPARVFETLPVGAVMNQDFYTVTKGESVDVAARVMAKNKYHAAVVVECGYAVGVFTTTDALRALSDALTDSLPGSSTAE